MKLKPQLLLIATFIALVLLIVYTTSNAVAMYLTDGTKSGATATPATLYANPGDGVCVVGLAANGTMTADPTITTNRACVAYTTGLTGLTAADVTATYVTNSTALSTCGATVNLPCNVAANCTATTGGNRVWNATTLQCLDKSLCTRTDGSLLWNVNLNIPANTGGKHAWSTSACFDGAGNGIPLTDLDNAATMCTSKGGTMTSAGGCVAYSWLYQNVKPVEAIPYRSTLGSGIVSGYTGRTSADNLGFCYASMRMTTAGYTTAALCPSFHNASTTAPAGEWLAGTDAVLYQTQVSYDAGLGWTFTNCLYAYGVAGYANADLKSPSGAIITAAGAFVDLRTLTTQGTCLAAGGSWDNWLPISAVTNAALTVATTTAQSTIVKLNATTPVLDASGNGGKFYSGTGSICTKCHTDQSRAMMERNKVGFVETGHKLAGDTGPTFWGSIGTPWGLKGVQCEICHATGKPTQQDLGLVIYPNPTGLNAGLPRAASGHNQTEYGSHATGVCFACHGTMPVALTDNPAAKIPVAAGEFALNTKNLAPIGNQFLNSPHAKFNGTSSTLSIITKSNYTSQFVGKVCRSSATLGSGNILTTVYRNGIAQTIPNSNAPTNTACSNPADGSATSGAAGFWLSEGEAAGTSNSVAYVSSDQGNCTTWNVHPVTSRISLTRIHHRSI